MVFYEVEDLVRFHWEEDVRAIRAQWQTFNDDGRLRQALMLASGYLRLKQSNNWIVDSQDTTGVLKSSDQDWIVSDLMPHLVTCGLRNLITISPTSALTALTTRQWQRNVRVGGFEVLMADVHSLEHAKEMLRGLPSRRISA